MQTTKIVNKKYHQYDIYIGRRSSGMHYGNPFSTKDSVAEVVKCSSRAEAIKNYEAWLNGEDFADLEQARRNWILSELSFVRGKILGCYCKPKPCHGDVLVKMANESYFMEY